MPSPEKKLLGIENAKLLKKDPFLYLNTIGGKMSVNQMQGQMHTTQFVSFMAEIKTGIESGSYSLDVFKQKLKSAIVLIPDSVISGEERDKFFQEITKPENFEELKKAVISKAKERENLTGSIVSTAIGKLEMATGTTVLSAEIAQMNTEKMENQYKFLYKIENIVKNLENPENYTFDSFKSDIENIIKYIPDIFIPKAKKQAFLVEVTKKENFEAIKKHVKDSKEGAKKISDDLETTRRKHSRLTEVQNRIFGSLTVDSSVNMGKIAKGSFDLNDFKEKITSKYLTHARLWASKARAKRQTQDAKTIGVYEDGLREKYIGKRDGTATTWLSQKGGGIGTFALGDISMWGMDDVGDDPMLKQLFTQNQSDNEAFVEAVYKTIAENPGGDDALRKIIRARIDKIVGEKNIDGEPLTLDDIKNNFKSFGSIDDLRKDVEKKDAVEFLRDKTLTISRSWRNSDVSKEYSIYVRKNGYGSMDFPKWIELKSQKEGMSAMIKYYWHRFLDMMPEKVLVFMGIGDSDKGDNKEINKYGKEYVEYDDILKNYSNNSEGVSGDDLPETPLIKASNLAAYKKLKTLYGKKRGTDTAEIDIKVGEKSIEEAELSADTSFLEIENLIRDKKGSYQLLSQGLDIEEIQFLAKHKGDGNDDGINVEFGDDGFEMSYDFQGFTESIFGGNFDSEGEFLGALATGGLAAYLLFTPAGWVTLTLSTILAAAAGAGAFHALEQIDWLKNGEKKFNYSDLSSEDLKTTMSEFKQVTDTLKNLTMDDLKNSISNFTEKYSKYLDLEEGGEMPETLLEGGDFCGSMKSLFKYMDEHSEKKLTGSDLEFLDKYFKDGGDDYGDMDFREVTIEAGMTSAIKSATYEDVYVGNKKTEDPDKVGTFLHIDGGGEGFTDDNFENLEAFFDYLKNVEFKKE